MMMMMMIYIKMTNF